MSEVSQQHAPQDLNNLLHHPTQAANGSSAWLVVENDAKNLPEGCTDGNVRVTRLEMDGRYQEFICWSTKKRFIRYWWTDTQMYGDWLMIHEGER